MSETVARPAGDEVILRMESITKIFPGVKALENVDLTVRTGSIHAICGENGAGKSTLIKVLCGIYAHGTYDGKIFLDETERMFSSTHEAEKAGIVSIHQELALVPEMSVAENIFLGNQPNRAGLINFDQMIRQADDLLKKVGINSLNSANNVNPNTKVINLGVGKQQLVEIAKALAKNARVLILDEPTSALTENEVDVLMDILDNLRKKNITCIYISHKLDEVIRIADDVTILRDGQTIDTKHISEITKSDIVRMMVGRELTNLFPREKHNPGEVAFEVKNYTVNNPWVAGKKLVNNISFNVRYGEIIGISGLMGSGRTELFSSIYGAFEARSEGEVYLEGKKLNIKSPTDAIKNGIYYLTEDRKKYGLVLGMSILENSTLSSLNKVSKYGLLNTNIERTLTQKFIDFLRTKTPSQLVKVSNLSGGNQQKVAIGKALMTQPKVLILDEPTRGIDVGAKYEIYKIMNQLVEQGVIVIMISSDLEEVLGMSDRILVFGIGELRGSVDISEADQEVIMNIATGVKSV
ncbi:MAG: sugar ABC transporter ATP-binding protein [Eubacteriales bacterium]|nr:sugar ABC transporter ATP-binding protein [Eubacteriales bacterium]